MDRDEDISVDSLLRYLGWGNVEVNIDEPFDKDETPFEMKPSGLLKCAEHDFSHDYDHHLVNALTNAKRAITRRIDNLLYHTESLGEASKRELELPPIDWST